jgi:uncharacterized membrane protein YeaQ/YmgE (transglycosylase-associated protein family)
LENLPVQLQKGEEVIVVLRRHIVYLARNMAGTVILGFVGALLLGWLASVAGALQTLLTIVLVLWVIGSILAALLLWYRYQNDLWVVTNQRLIDSVQRHPFNKQITSTDLINVQDMSIVKNGVLATAFNYGDLRCQTAGTASIFTLSGIADPSDALTVVDAARDNARREIGKTNMQAATASV